MIGTYLSMNAWREVLTRVFVDVPAQDNVSPPWLVNPATKRRLKLDRWYPDLHVAIRFVGLMAKGVGRQSDEELRDSENRDETRDELCRRNGVELVRIDADGEEPVKQLEELLRAISRAGRIIQESKLPSPDKSRWTTAVARARANADDLRTLIQRNPEQMMANLADAWRDREAGLTHAPAQPAPKATPAGRGLRPKEGDRVQHERFGPGVVTTIQPDGQGDARISILFDAAQERTFLLSLVQDKLRRER